MHDGSISTSAGITSGIDLALSLVERDYGSILAAKAARDLVVYMRRNGQAGPPSVYLQYRTHLHGGVHRVQDYLMQNPVRQASDEVLAQLAGLTVRGLARAFKVQTGLSMSEYRTRLQLEVARELMLDPRLTLEEISNRSGFSDPRHFRRTWKAIFGHPPSVSRLTPHPISASEKVTPSLTRRGAGNPPLQPIVEHDA
ncbi:hypothetical protein ASF71_19175 [Deinococcus sp. Leaf326]|nr:hypothetical protein ASF71_19175 [Deinococcus sp. Leaf326]